ncbi:MULTISPECIES: Rha family transcriptional regulator [unclassified Acinetobacter]|uniref:Rha family transcriptional regulator n=1 Tax=unclassified Acinetobacter TaxID=196816 RepID=UPI00068EC276|nr:MULTISPECIES: phage regulatory protein/antirepressor Ant [unclassified Acinetobacter]WEE38371.1 phage regulatory protein/antirepressor Ant [Acinetobacter sp. TAC-1]
MNALLNKNQKDVGNFSPTYSEQAKQQTLTMSSREIAELTGKEHKNVCRVIRDLISDHILDAQLEPLKFEYRGQWFDYYELNKRDSFVVVARLSPEFTAHIVDRWQELENQSPKELSRLEILQIALHAEEEKQALQGQVQLLEPKAQALDVLSNSYGTETLDCAAHSMGIQARKTLRPWMKENGWLHKDKDGNWRALGHRITAGHLIEVDRVYTDSQGFPQHTITVYITPKGKTVLTTSLIKAGMIKGDRHETTI